MRWTLIACAAIVAFDTGTGLAAEALAFGRDGFPWVIGSTAIMAFPAVMAVREGQGLRAAAVAGAAVGLAEATLGWAVSWVIGIGAPPPEFRNLGAVTLIGLSVVTIGGVVGLVAGLITRRVPPRSSPG